MQNNNYPNGGYPPIIYCTNKNIIKKEENKKNQNNLKDSLLIKTSIPTKIINNASILNNIDEIQEI